jgi:flagellar basal body rod protein FlgG
MSGSQYIALSGLRARLDELDRLAADIANIGSAGYKGQRTARASAERPQFDRALQTAIDTTAGGERVDMTSGAFAPTGRPLDLALEGPGFFVVATATGESYTRNGHFTINSERQLVAEDGALVVGDEGPITLGDGDIRVDDDGSVWAGSARAGRLKVVEFADPGALDRSSATRFLSSGQNPGDATGSVVRSGALEQSNVSLAERIAHLTTVSRGFEAMQKAISTVMNEVDGRAIDVLGRR